MITTRATTHIDILDWCVEQGMGTRSQFEHALTTLWPRAFTHGWTHLDTAAALVKLSRAYRTVEAAAQALHALFDILPADSVACLAVLVLVRDH